MMSPPLMKTPHERMQEELSAIAQNVLKKKCVVAKIDSLTLKEDVAKGISSISCTLRLNSERIKIKGDGCGVVDALFSALLAALSEKYVSLKNLELLDFSVEADFKKTYRNTSKMDAPVEVRLLLSGGGDGKFIFRETSPSMVTAAIKAITSAAEYFINSELAVESLYKGIQGAKKRTRPDLIELYTFQLSELVKNVSYEEKIKDLSED